MLVAFHNMIAGMKANKNLSPIVTELFLKEKNLKFHLFLHDSLILKWLKL